MNGCNPIHDIPDTVVGAISSIEQIIYIVFTQQLMPLNVIGKCNGSVPSSPYMVIDGLYAEDPKKSTSDCVICYSY